MKTKFHIACLLSVFLFIFGSSFFTTFMTIYLAENGVRQLDIGYIQSVFYAGMLFGTFVVTPQIRYFGHAYAYLILACTAALTIILQLYFQNIFTWIVLRFIFGLCISGVYIVIESWLLTTSTLPPHGNMLSIYMTVLYGTQVISHEFLRFAGLQSEMNFLICALLCFISSLPIFFVSTPYLEVKKINIIKRFDNVISLFHASPFGFISCFFSGLIISVIFSCIPTYANFYDFSVSGVMQSIIIGGCIFQLFINKLSSFFQKYNIFLILNITTALSAFMIFIFASKILLLYIFCVFLGGSSFSLYTLCIAKVCGNLDQSAVTYANAILLFVYGAGSICGPVIASFGMNFVSMNFLFCYISFVSILLSLISLYIKTDNK